MTQEDLQQRIKALPCWQSAVTPEPLAGGITNVNYSVDDNGRRYVVRIGGDIPVHHIMRFNELAANRAAAALGISPAVVYTEPGVMVLEFVAGQVFGEADVRAPKNLARIVAILQVLHHQVPHQLRGPALVFWVFQVLRDYANTLRAQDSPHLDKLPRLLEIGADLETRVGPVTIVFSHNDLLPANFIDAGDKLWLIDFDYAGFNSPLFDLANLASNNQLSEPQERQLLEAYFETAVSDARWTAYGAMKCASLLREVLWSMVSEVHSGLDFDYGAYTQENLARFEQTYATYRDAELG